MHRPVNEPAPHTRTRHLLSGLADLIRANLRRPWVDTDESFTCIRIEGMIAELKEIASDARKKY